MEQAELVDGFVKDILKPILANRGSTAVGSGRRRQHLVHRRHAPPPARLELVDGDHLMQQARLIKSDVEIAIIEESCAIGDAVTQRRSTRPGPVAASSRSPAMPCRPCSTSAARWPT